MPCQAADSAINDASTGKRNASVLPDPVPAVFGYHEIFHVLVIAAALLQFAAIAFFVLPEA